ncbi:MAG TPA: carboxypeptidase-like regulatory domain-containing protein, partial [Pyrinomonadaceae bacterium]|nr:carboxypeptidase-like regulatory domain-containing protein [Pyrinomonadaceae bacterium]
MWSSKSQILIVLLLICIPSIASAQDPRERKPAGNSIIMGRVIYADTGRPVRRATVRLYREVNGTEARVTPANARGEFRFTEVDDGTYFVVAEAPGILSPLSAFSISELGFGGYRGSDYTRVTVDGKNSIRCEVRAIRAGTIKGTITYDDKEPLVKGRIVLYRRKGNAMGPFFTKPVTTNDRGMYRVDGLPDGEYVVGIAYGQITARAPAEGAEVAGITNAFYPGVRSLAEAKPIQIQSGSEVANVDLTLNDDVLRQISGTVKWRSGKLVTEGGVSLRRKGDPNLDMSFSSFMRLGSLRDDDDDDDQLFKSLPMLMLTMP